MAQHRTLKIEDLSEDELELICISGNLSFCPKCREPLKNVCIQDGDLSGGTGLFGDREDYEACHVCKIVWKYERKKWINERGDGMVIGEGIHVYLTAITDCFHAKRLIQLFKAGAKFVQWWPEVKKI